MFAAVQYSAEAVQCRSSTVQRRVCQHVCHGHAASRPGCSQAGRQVGFAVPLVRPKRPILNECSHTYITNCTILIHVIRLSVRACITPSASIRRPIMAATISACMHTSGPPIQSVHTSASAPARWRRRRAAPPLHHNRVRPVARIIPGIIVAAAAWRRRPPLRRRRAPPAATWRRRRPTRHRRSLRLIRRQWRAWWRYGR